MAVMYPKNIHVLDPEDSEIEVYEQLKKLYMDRKEGRQ